MTNLNSELGFELNNFEDVGQLMYQLELWKSIKTFLDERGLNQVHVVKVYINRDEYGDPDISSIDFFDKDNKQILDILDTIVSDDDNEDQYYNEFGDTPEQALRDHLNNWMSMDSLEIISGTWKRDAI